MTEKQNTTFRNIATAGEGVSVCNISDISEMFLGPSKFANSMKQTYAVPWLLQIIETKISDSTFTNWCLINNAIQQSIDQYVTTHNSIIF
jgi:hypothetical protein